MKVKHSLHVRRPRCSAAVLFLMFLAVVAVLWTHTAVAQQPALQKLTLLQIEGLVAHGVPDSTMAAQIQKRGLAFTPKPANLDSLQAKGAGPLTLAAIEALASKTPSRAETNAGGKVAGRHPRAALGMGTVEIRTEPGSAVLLDGKEAGNAGYFNANAGLIRLEDVTEGNHELTAKKAGFQDAHVGFTLADKEDKQVSLPLQWLGGFLTVVAQPAGAAIKVTGPQSNDGSTTDLKCLPGTYTVTVSFEGYVPQTRNFQVAMGEHHAEQVQLALDPAFVASLLADAKAKLSSGNPSGAAESARRILRLTPGDLHPEEILSEASFLTGDFQTFVDAGNNAIRAGGAVTIPLMHVHSFPHRMVHDVTLTFDRSGLTYKPATDTKGCKIQSFTQPLSAIKDVVVQRDLSGSVELHLELASSQMDLMAGGSQIPKPQHEKGVISLGIGNPKFIPIESPDNAEQLLLAVKNLMLALRG